MSFYLLYMNKIIEFFIRGILSLIWLIAAIVTSVVLSPFLIVGWISGKVTKSDQGEDQQRMD